MQLGVAKFPGGKMSNSDTYTSTLGSSNKKTLPFSSLYNLVSSSCSASSCSTRTCPAILDCPVHLAAQDLGSVSVTLDATYPHLA